MADAKRIKKGLRLLSKQKPKERASSLKKADSVVFTDIRCICRGICDDPGLKNSKNLKKHRKIKHIIRKIAKTASPKKIKKILLDTNIKFGNGVFTLLGSVLLPLIGNLIAKNV